MTVTSETTDPTCEDAGKIIYTASFTVNGATYTDPETRTETLNALDHDWDYANAVFNWDGCACPTATVTCLNDASHTADIEVTVKSETTDPTCEVDGKTVYTASFTVDGVTYTDLETRTETLEASGHDLKTTVVAPTCTDEGYTLHVCRNCRYSYTDEIRSATGHSWSAPKWKWSGTKAEATFTCANGDHPETVAAKVTDETVKDPTDTETGKKLYTATVEFDGKTYTDTMEKSIPALNEGLCKWCGERHEGFWGKIVGFFHSIAYFFAHLFGKK